MDYENMSDFEILLRGFRAQVEEIDRLKELNALFERKLKLLEELLRLERERRLENEYERIRE